MRNFAARIDTVAVVALALVAASAAGARADESSLVSIPAVSTSPGAQFDASVHVAEDTMLIHLELHVVNDPSLVRLTGFTLGSAVQSYLRQNGEPPACDIIVYPDGDGMMAIMLLGEPFRASEHGTEWLVLHYEATAAAPASACIDLHYTSGFIDETGQDMRDEVGNICGEVTIGPGQTGSTALFLRGDVNNDLSCNISDAARILGHLFLGSGHVISCADAADINDDGTLNVSDPVHLLGQLYLGNGGPMNETCARDGTEDALPDCGTNSCDSVLARPQ